MALRGEIWGHKQSCEFLHGNETEKLTHLNLHGFNTGGSKVRPLLELMSVSWF